MARVFGIASAIRPALRWLAVASAAGMLAGASAQPVAAHEPATTLQTALRTCSGDARTVELPDTVRLGQGAPPPLACRYTIPNAAAGPHHGTGLFIAGLFAHARISVNGVVLSDTLQDPMAPLPRSIDRILLLDVPDALWRTGENRIEIDAAGPRWLALSSIRLGPVAELRREHRLRVLGVVIGPALVAAVVGSLGLCMLLLWARRRDPLFGYFGVGTLCWAIHTAWTVLPWSPLPGDQHTVWWTSLYVFFVAMLVIFCVRFADWRWPRFERLLWAFALAAPALLYGALGFDRLGETTGLLRLLLIGLVGVGLAAVVRACLERPEMDRLLVLASAYTAFAFGVHDWLKDMNDRAGNPVYLVPYAGLVFMVFVVRMLIYRFVRTTEQLETMNAGLEQRVASQNTELRDAVEQVRVARDAAEAADRAKSRFLAAASHDLRQPAHALGLYMASLRAERLDPTQADLVQRMSGSLSALETMFNLLLDVSRVDAGAMTPAPKAFAIEPMLRGLAEEFAPQAEAQGLRLGLRLPSHLMPIAHSDPALVERIVRNLLANAVKYTSAGGVLLACRLRHTGQPSANGGAALPCWRIEVWDTGIGIAEDDRQRVFEEFFQVGNPGRDRSKGLGLGLSIVHRLVALLGLKLLLFSRPGRGSCFALCLPTSHAVAMPVAASHAHTVASLAGMTVGLIEDDLEVRDAMRILLQRWGCTVVEGADAGQLDAQIDSRSRHGLPEALLVDQRLDADKTGPGEAMALFERWQTRVPMLVITGESELDISDPTGQPGRLGISNPTGQAGRLDISDPAGQPGRLDSTNPAGQAGELEGRDPTGQGVMMKPISPSLLRSWLASVRTRPPVQPALATTARASGDSA